MDLWLLASLSDKCQVRPNYGLRDGTYFIDGLEFLINAAQRELTVTLGERPGLNAVAKHDSVANVAIAAGKMYLVGVQAKKSGSADGELNFTYQPTGGSVTTARKTKVTSDELRWYVALYPAGELGAGNVSATGTGITTGGMRVQELQDICGRRISGTGGGVGGGSSYEPQDEDITGVPYQPPPSPPDEFDDDIRVPGGGRTTTTFVGDAQKFIDHE